MGNPLAGGQEKMIYRDFCSVPAHLVYLASGMTSELYDFLSSVFSDVKPRFELPSAPDVVLVDGQYGIEITRASGYLPQRRKDEAELVKYLNRPDVDIERVDCIDFTEKVNVSSQISTFDQIERHRQEFKKTVQKHSKQVATYRKSGFLVDTAPIALLVQSEFDLGGWPYAWWFDPILLHEIETSNFDYVFWYHFDDAVLRREPTMAMGPDGYLIPMPRLVVFDVKANRRLITPSRHHRRAALPDVVADSVEHEPGRTKSR